MLRYGVYQKDFADTYSTGPIRHQGSSVRSMIAQVPSSRSNFYTIEIFKWKNGNVYLALIERYFHHFSLGLSNGIHGDSRISARILPPETELFLWFAVDLWIDIAVIVNRDFSKITNMYSGSKDSSYYHNHHHTHQNAFGPKSCADVIFLDANSPSPTCASMQCSYLLLAHLQKAALGCTDAPYLSIPLTSPARGGPTGRHNRVSGKIDGPSWKMFLLPRGLEILQQPIFDMLRALFIKFDAISASQQVMAMALWLRWTQPWRFYEAGGDIFGDEQSRYAIEWRPYVAANLHFYTSLFVVFIRSSVYLNSFSWMSARASSSSYARDGSNLSAMSSSSSGSGDKDILKISMKLFCKIVESYSIPGINGVSLFDDVSLLYSGVVATGGDVTNVGSSPIVREPTPVKPLRRSSTKKMTAQVQDSVELTGGIRHVRSTAQLRQKFSPHRYITSTF